MEKSPSRWWDFPSAALLVVAMLVSTWRLTITNWTPHIGYVSNLAFVGTIVGLALGRSHFGKPGVRLLGLGYTLVMIPWRLTGFYDSEIELQERLLSIGGRILFSLSEYAANRPVRDELFLVFLLSFGYWLIGLIAGYSLIRYARYLTAVIPGALAMIIVHQFDPSFPSRIWFIAVYFALALALLGRQQFLRRRVEWAKDRMHVSPETGQDLSVVAMIAAGALVLIAWVVPPRISPPLAGTWENITRPWRDTSERMGQAFASVESESGRGDYFRETLNLGNRANLNESIVFTVFAPPESLTLPRLYWRGRVYDHYENGQWTSSDRVTDTFSPQREEFAVDENERRKLYDFTMKSFIQGQSTLYLPGQPVWVSRPVDAEFFELEDGRQDVLVLLAYPFIESGETYHTRSTIANPSITELREAGEEYPQWIMDRYLQLPEEFSESVRAFAEEVTASSSTPYDKADAITTALRAQIEYQARIEPPDDGRDLMEWFLFDAKKGYCNYYATAEVLMLRLLGIPARLAVGFSQGENNEDRLIYIVRNQNAHAWPEVYFPGYGWVEFEPTGNQSPLVRPERPVGASPEEEVGPEQGANAAPPTPVATPEAVGELGDGGPPSASRGYYLPILLLTVLLLGFAAVFVLLNRRVPLVARAADYFMSVAERRGLQLPDWIRNTALYARLDPIERSFHVINLSLRWLGKTPALHYTPADRAAALISLLPEATEEIETLQREYQASLYSPRSGNQVLAQGASQKILRKSLRAVFRRAWHDQ